MPQPFEQELPLKLRAVAGLLAQGLANRAIGLELSLAEHTVENYVSEILELLNCMNRTQAALKLSRYAPD